MTLTTVQTNLADAMQQQALELLIAKSRMNAITAMWVTEGMNALTDADLQALASFAHITVAELTAAKNAMDAILTTIGEYAAGTNATKLVRIVGNVPH